MIRINLLPQKKRRVESGGGEGWVFAALAAVFVEVVLLFFFNSMKETELAEERAKNDKLSAQIANSKNNVANHAEVKSELERLRAREDAIQKLQTARSGPTAVMLEVSRILSTGKGPTVDAEKLAQVRRENPLAVYNPGWDARRLWLTSFVEEHRVLRISGVARDGSDVSELARRMSLSDFFANVKLLEGTKKVDESSLDVVKFALEAEVKY